MENGSPVIYYPTAPPANLTTAYPTIESLPPRQSFEQSTPFNVCVSSQQSVTSDSGIYGGPNGYMTQMPVPHYIPAPVQYNQPYGTYQPFGLQNGTETGDFSLFNNRVGLPMLPQSILQYPMSHPMILVNTAGPMQPSSFAMVPYITSEPIQYPMQMPQPRLASVNTNSPTLLSHPRPPLLLDQGVLPPTPSIQVSSNIPRKVNETSSSQNSPKSSMNKVANPSQERINNALRKNGNAYLNNILYKTELCKDFVRSKECPRNATCQFAHGEEDKFDPHDHPLYKTAFCVDFRMNGKCPRMNECFHVHEATEMRAKRIRYRLYRHEDKNRQNAQRSLNSADLGAPQSNQRRTSIQPLMNEPILPPPPVRESADGQIAVESKECSPTESSKLKISKPSMLQIINKTSNLVFDLKSDRAN